jgi:predicted RNase H-like nuclease
VAVLGVDGWRGQWVAARLDGRSVELSVLPDAAAVLAIRRNVQLIGIDIPIGLSDDGARTCDVEARRRMPGAASSVFPAPVRAVLGTTTYDEARATSLAASGRSLSVQTFALVPAIRSVDDALGDPPYPLVHEVHPELSFRALDGRVTDRKVSGSGLAQRIRALEQEMDVLDALAVAPEGLPVVDALDACAAAWSAQRIADGRAESVGDGRRDARGRPMRISF